jgi:hypothetical protein
VPGCPSGYGLFSSSVDLGDVWRFVLLPLGPRGVWDSFSSSSSVSSFVLVDRSRETVDEPKDEGGVSVGNTA